VNTEKVVARVLSRLAPLKRAVLEPTVWKLALGGHNVSLYLGLRQPWLQRLGVRTVVDIGANIGQFALVARAAFPHATLHCFEPLPDCFQQLQKHLGKRPGVILHNVALGARAETRAMIRNPYSPSSSLLEMAPSHVRAFPFTAGGERVPVSVSTLDAELAGQGIEEPVLLKIDVQGTEDRVIAGGRSILTRTAVAIIETSFEPLYAGQLLFDEIQEVMRGLRFSYRGNLGQLNSPEDGRVLQCDAVFVHAA
jgi:FkbM family methyltransferase